MHGQVRASHCQSSLHNPGRDKRKTTERQHRRDPEGPRAAGNRAFPRRIGIKIEAPHFRRAGSLKLSLPLGSSRDVNQRKKLPPLPLPRRFTSSPHLTSPSSSSRRRLAPTCSGPLHPCFPPLSSLLRVHCNGGSINQWRPRSGRRLGFSVSSRSLPTAGPPTASSPSPLPTVATGMSCGGGHAGGGQKPAPATAHPRRIPKRGAVLRGAVRGALRFLLSPVSGAPAIGGRVRPAPPPSPGGGDVAAGGAGEAGGRHRIIRRV